jgi:hypothetical protein
MTLPVPTPPEVEAFKKIYFEEFGVELSNGEVYEAATIVLQLFYLVTYGVEHVDN